MLSLTCIDSVRYYLSISELGGRGDGTLEAPRIGKGTHTQDLISACGVTAKQTEENVF